MHKPPLPIALTLVVCCLLNPPPTVLRADFTQIVAFGDSLTDTGNVFNLFGNLAVGPPYVQGRFSNGPVYVERLAERLAIVPPTPSRLGGNNYAHGSAETGAGNVNFLVPNLGTQVNTYLASSPTINSQQLFVLFGGANDFLGSQSNPTVPVNNLSSYIAALSTRGATSFLVPNLPPLGLTPAHRGTVNEMRLNDLSVAFNVSLEAELSRLENSLAIKIYRLDTYGLLQAAIANPALYGLTNVTDAAYNAATGNVVANPNEYLFWDTLHPTATAHRFLGDRAFAAVPEPASALVIAVSLVVLNVRFRRRTRVMNNPS
jgi:thermolabile hemolysin